MTSYLWVQYFILAMGSIWSIAMIWGVGVAYFLNADLNKFLEDDIFLFWGGMVVIFGLGFAIYAMFDTKKTERAKAKV